MTEILYKELSYQIIGCAMKIQSTLVSGFLEKVYENVLMVEFRKSNIKAEQQSVIKVFYDGEVVGDYRADILVDGKIILEPKCVDKITNIHRVQSLNYLKATDLKLSLILNFKNKSLESERIIL